MTAMIVYIYFESVSGVQVPLHGCWQKTTHLFNIYNRVGSAFEYVF